MAEPIGIQGERLTRNNDMGAPPYVVEKMLNHTFDGVMAFYTMPNTTLSDGRRWTHGRVG